MFGTGPAVNGSRKFVVIDLDQRRRVLGYIAVLTDDDGYGFTHIRYFAIRKRERPDLVERRARIGMAIHAAVAHDRSEIIERKNCMHARELAGWARIDGANDGVGVRTADEACVKQIGEVDIVDKAAAAPQQRLVLDTGNALSDQTSLRHQIGAKWFFPTIKTTRRMLFGYRRCRLCEDFLGCRVNFFDQRLD